MTALSSFIVYRMNVHYQKKIEHKYESKIEKLKTRLEVLSYESNKYFDAQFSTYRELCHSFFEMISAVYWLFPSNFESAPISQDWEKICQERYLKAQKEYNTAASVLGINAPFIPEDKYNPFHEILELASTQINTYVLSDPCNKGCYQGAISFRNEGYSRTGIIEQKWNSLLTQLRKDMKVLHHNRNVEYSEGEENE